MSVQSFYDELRSYLRITTNVEPSNSNIEVGDTFELTITVTNDAPSTGSRYHNPILRFTNINVEVRGTEYAEPVDGSTVNVPINDSVLSQNGDSGSVTVPMRAITAIMPLWDPFSFVTVEDIARVGVGADVDTGRFFRIRNYKDTQTNIVAV